MQISRQPSNPESSFSLFSQSSPCQINQIQKVALNPQTLTTNPTTSQNHFGQSPNNNDNSSKTPKEDNLKTKAEKSLNSTNSPPKNQTESLGPNHNLNLNHNPNAAEDPVLSNKGLSPTWTQTQL